MCFSAGVQALGGQSIYALRAAYLYYFSYFIQWPETVAFENNQLNLCVLIDDEEDRFQLQTIDLKAVGSNQLKVRFLESLTDSSFDLTRCHMLYVSEKNATDPDMRNMPFPENLLLVTEGKATKKGFIHLGVKSKKLKFEINNELLKARGFKVSSKLMRLAM